MSTPEYERWQALTVRRPEDVRGERGGPVPLLWQAEKRAGHNDRLSHRRLPADFPYDVERGDAGDALAALALGEAMRRDIEQERASRVREALELGATWPEVAAALDIEEEAARALLREWAEAQHRVLYLRDVEAGRTPLGMGPEEHAAVLALCERDDAGASA